MTYRELVKKLRRHGCELVRQAPGSHEVWWNPATQKVTTILRHTGDIHKGLLAAILRDLGLRRDDLE